MDQIRIGIVGYGNLGRGVEYALRQNPDMALVGVFTRRPPSSLTLQTPGVPVYPLDALDGMEGAVDVLLLCGGSAADLPEQSPRYAGRFHLVDSFDTHAYLNDLRSGHASTKESEQFQRRLNRYRERYLFPDENVTETEDEQA